MEKTNKIISSQKKQITEDRQNEIGSLLQEKENFKFTIDKIQKERLEETETFKNVEFF